MLPCPNVVRWIRELSTDCGELVVAFESALNFDCTQEYPMGSKCCAWLMCVFLVHQGACKVIACQYKKWAQVTNVQAGASLCCINSRGNKFMWLGENKVVPVELVIWESCLEVFWSGPMRKNTLLNGKYAVGSDANFGNMFLRHIEISKSWLMRYCLCLVRKGWKGRVTRKRTVVRKLRKIMCENMLKYFQWTRN